MDFSSLTWVLQSNAVGPTDLQAVSSSVTSLGAKLALIRVVPFSHEPADPLPDVPGPCLIYGSSGLLRLAHRLGWAPAGWDGSAFGVAATIRGLGKRALNDGAVLSPWSDAAKAARTNGWQTVFVRPEAETKEFQGRVVDLDALQAWIETLHDVEYVETANNMAMVAPASTLRKEWRIFVVGGRQVSACQYAEAGVPHQKEGVPASVISFVGDVIATYSPASCFVIDVAEVLADGRWHLKVVEFNSINSAGFYLCDVGRVVMALSALALEDRGAL
jgi:hypothetical protein